ncbi:MAG: PqiC family protein [Methylotetracoccus sp.]|jgi:cholesterol transport system auxiliary component|nr:PqiC family protein [Methylotetracoccus sp.]
MNTLHFSRLLTACLLLLAGCQVLPARPPLPALHDFGPAPPSAGEAPPWSAVSVDAPEWLQDPMICYRLLYAQPTQVRFYALDRWVASPPDLLAHRWASSRAAEGYELKIELQGFEQVFERPDQSSVSLRFHAEAVDPVRGHSVAERVFRLSQPTRSANAAGAVEAFSRLVSQAAAQVSDWMAKLPPSEHLGTQPSAPR